MRPWLSHLIMSSLLFICACGPSDVRESADAQEFQSVEEADDQPELVAWGSEAARELGFGRTWTGDLDSLVERRLIRVLAPYGKTYFFLDGSVQRGLTYEAFREFEKHLNQELKTGTRRVHVMLIPTARDYLLQGLIDGRGDIAAGGLTITPARQEIVDFTEPFTKSVREIVVSGPGAPPLSSLDDLAGQEILVRRSSSYYESLTSLNETFEASGRPAMTLKPADEILEDEDLLEMVNAGLVPIVVVDQHKADLWAQVFESIVVHPELAVRTGGEVGWAFRKNSPRLAATLNRFVARNPEGSYLFNVLWQRYWENAAWIRNPGSASERERYRAVVDLFTRYSGEYDFPHLMMLAQGYQESGLDQSVRSQAGAVGIMQLLPSTAADPNVGIADISTPESNIHAGIKYMRFIRRSYFSDPAIPEREQILFSIAAYNAGPNRIERLRGVAADRGLNPNLWFRNVELVVAEKVGRETIQYVDNIFKYYTAYGMIEAQEKARQEAKEQGRGEAPGGASR